MKSLIAFIKKELLEQLRSSKLTVIVILFVIFGVMNPAIAKLTPWLLETLSDSLAESGMTVTVMSVTALDSWVQFFKNMPIALIAFVLLESTIFTKEYGTGTLVLSLTKGLKRFKVVVSKSGILTALWTLGYWLCFGITYAYNAYFWDNAIAKNLGFSVTCWWLFGVFVISLITLFSSLSTGNTGVLIGSGGVVFSLYIIGLIPKANKYLPTLLTDGASLIYGAAEIKDLVVPVVITAAATVICFAVSVPLFNKKQL